MASLTVSCKLMRAVSLINGLLIWPVTKICTRDHIESSEIKTQRGDFRFITKGAQNNHFPVSLMLM